MNLSCFRLVRRESDRSKPDRSTPERWGPTGWVAALTLLTLAGLSSACGSTRTGSPAAITDPRQPSESRVVVLALDGAQALMLHRLHAEGVLDAEGFGRFFREGEVAEGMISVNPTLTAPSHVSLITGADPAATGIVSNRFRPAGAGPGGAVSGFTAPIEIETLWQAAMKRGMPVGIVTYPGADNEAPERRGDWGMAWNGSAERRPQIIDLDFADWTPVSEDTESGRDIAGVATFASSPIATVESRLEDHLYEFRALDTVDDGVTAFDALWIGERAADGSVARSASRLVRPGSWTTLPSGVAVKVLALTADLAKTRIVLGGQWKNLAYGDGYVQELERRDLLWPGPPNDDLLDPENESAADLVAFREQAERFAEFFGDAILAGIESQDWRLLIGYVPVIDEVLHELPPGSEAGDRRIAAVQQAAWQVVDRQLARILEALDLETTTVFVVSDHGMVATELTAFPNGHLAGEGWVVLNSETGRVDRSRSQALVETSGAVGHLYLGDELSAPPSALLAEIKASLESWQVEGQPVLERVVSRSEAAALGLGSANSGDLILFARPGVTLSWRSDRESEPVDRLGMHGYLNHHPEMHGIFMAVGAGVDYQRSGRVPSSVLFPRVAERLGLD